jgi:hypothetical protein
MVAPFKPQPITYKTNASLDSEDYMPPQTQASEEEVGNFDWSMFDWICPPARSQNETYAKWWVEECQEPTPIAEPEESTFSNETPFFLGGFNTAVNSSAGWNNFSVVPSDFWDSPSSSESSPATVNACYQCAQCYLHCTFGELNAPNRPQYGELQHFPSTTQNRVLVRRPGTI